MLAKEGEKKCETLCFLVQTTQSQRDECVMGKEYLKYAFHKSWKAVQILTADSF